jgi:hypothetical protein
MAASGIGRQASETAGGNGPASVFGWIQLHCLIRPTFLPAPARPGAVVLRAGCSTLSTAFFLQAICGKTRSISSFDPRR